MHLPDRHLLLGMTLGAICATALAAIGPGAVVDVFADEMRSGIDTSRLVKIVGEGRNAVVEDWVDTMPASSTRIKKIEGGRVSYVDIVSTSTGTYSSDAMGSPHVQYPGISVEEADGRGYGFSRVQRLPVHLQSIVDVLAPLRELTGQ